MKPLLVTLLAVLSVGANLRFTAAQMLTGVISDSLCAGSHATMATQVDPPLSDANCTRACVDANGKFVLLDDSKKVIAIVNQDFVGLREHAGQKVKLTGEVKGDGVMIATIEEAERAKQ